MFAVGLTLGLQGPAHAQQAPEDLEFASAEAWYVGQDAADRKFAELTPQWLRLQAVTPLRKVDQDLLTASLRGFEARRQNLENELMLERNHLAIVEQALTDRRAELTLAREGEEARAAAVLASRQELNELGERLNNSWLQLRTLLASLDTTEARRAQSDLVAWWQGYKEIDWASVVSEGGHERTLARHDALQEQAIVSCQGAGQAVGSACGVVMRGVSAMREAHEHAYEVEQIARGLSAVRITHLDDEVRSFEREQAQSSREIEQLTDRLADLDENITLAGQALGQTTDEELEVLAPVTERFRELNLLYGALLRSMVSMDGRLDAARWCRLYVHAGLTRAMAREPNAVELLRVAAGSYEGACRSEMAPWSDVPAFQVLWSESLLLAAQAGQSWIWIPLTNGLWVLDGVPLSIGTASLIPITAGTHRIELRRSDAPPAQLLEDFGQSIRYLVSWDGARGLSIDEYQIGQPEDPRSFAPSLMPWSERDQLPPPFARRADQERERLWTVAAVSLVRFQSTEHIGATLGLSRRFSSGEGLQLRGFVCADLLVGSQSYVLSESWVSPVLPRLRTGLSLQTRPGNTVGYLSLGGGTIAPVAALVTTGATGLIQRIDDDRALRLELGMHATFWGASSGLLDPAPELGPELSVGVLR